MLKEEREMGQKISPLLIRLGKSRKWESSWNGKETYIGKWYKEKLIREYMNLVYSGKNRGKVQSKNIENKTKKENKIEKVIKEIRKIGDKQKVKRVIEKKIKEKGIWEIRVGMWVMEKKKPELDIKKKEGKLYKGNRKKVGGYVIKSGPKVRVKQMEGEMLRMEWHPYMHRKQRTAWEKMVYIQGDKTVRLIIANKVNFLGIRKGEDKKRKRGISNKKGDNRYGRKSQYWKEVKRKSVNIQLKEKKQELGRYTSRENVRVKVKKPIKEKIIHNIKIMLSKGEIAIKYRYTKTANAYIFIENISRFLLSYIKQNRGGKNKLQTMKRMGEKILEVIKHKKKNIKGIGMRYAGRVYGGTRAANFKISKGSLAVNSMGVDMDYAQIYRNTKNGMWGFQGWVSYSY